MAPRKTVPPANASTPAATEQHVYYHEDRAYSPFVGVKIERNSKGYNWEVSVGGSPDVDTAIALLRDAEDKLRARYGDQTAASRIVQTAVPPLTPDADLPV